MIDGLGRRLPVENGPAIAAAEAQPARTSTVYRAWPKLSPERRLAAVERKLKPSNEFSDGYPLVL